MVIFRVSLKLAKSVLEADSSFARELKTGVSGKKRITPKEIWKLRCLRNTLVLLPCMVKFWSREKSKGLLGEWG